MISYNYVGPMQTSLSRHMILNCLYQARKLRGHGYVWYGQHLCLYLQFCNWILELFRQCGICCFCVRCQNCSDSVELFSFLLGFRIVLTVWNWFFFFRSQNCTDSVELLVFFCQILELFRQCSICFISVRLYNCSDSVVFVVFQFDFTTVPTVWYSLFFCQILELY